MLPTLPDSAEQAGQVPSWPFGERNNFHKGFLADGAWTESDSPLNA